jgi:pimeloyl-ACP methyl ester carboxylesterase
MLLVVFAPLQLIRPAVKGTLADMEKLRSFDGTEIAFDRLGRGRPIVLVCGASTDRRVHTSLAERLAANHMVLNYDRRGRGDSGDMLPFAVEREVEDLGTMIAAAGEPATVFGSSSGAILALRAATAGLPISRLALWEPPFMVEGWGEYVSRLGTALAAGRRGDAVIAFMRQVGLPEEQIADMRRSPMWSGLEAIAHTLAYDAAVMADAGLPAGVASVEVPTLVLTGTETGAWTDRATAALVAALPAVEHRVLEGQSHAVDKDVLAAALEDWLASPVL